ncbi:hypothetical protein [Streptomyces sp. NPDC051572]|uniref:hypothetical protein n=1 Tax=Streptomyces sp. NPDC051572 TaxID=3155802 RepID=UPI0034510E90
MDQRGAELVGEPPDCLLLDITGWRSEEIDGVCLLTELGQFAPGGRALYDPHPDDPVRWHWGATPPDGLPLGRVKARQRRNSPRVTGRSAVLDPINEMYVSEPGLVVVAAADGASAARRPRPGAAG